MRKIFRRIHLWLSIPFGLIISVLCLTGAILIFEPEIKAIIQPGLYKTAEGKTGTGAMPLSELVPAIQRQLPDSASISTVTVYPQKERNYRVGIAGGGRRSLMIDPYTAEIKGEVVPYAKGEFFSVVRRMHRWLMDSYKRGGFSFGKFMTGLSTLLFVFILITGVVIWLPRTLKAVKNRLKIKTGAGGKRFWYDVHVSGGFYALLFLLVMSITGLTWSFTWYRNAFYKVFGVDMTAPASHGAAAGSGGPQSGSRRHGEKSSEPDYAVWDKAMAEVRRLNPGYVSMTVQDGSVSVSINKRGNTRASDKYTFNTRTGSLTGTEYYRDSPKSTKMRGWIYAVHTGSFGGLFTKILYLVACLTGTALPLTGYYFWLRKKFKKSHKRTL